MTKAHTRVYRPRNGPPVVVKLTPIVEAVRAARYRGTESIKSIADRFGVSANWVYRHIFPMTDRAVRGSKLERVPTEPPLSGEFDLSGVPERLYNLWRLIRRRAEAKQQNRRKPSRYIKEAWSRYGLVASVSVFSDSEPPERLAGAHCYSCDLFFLLLSDAQGHSCHYENKFRVYAGRPVPPEQQVVYEAEVALMASQTKHQGRSRESLIALGARYATGTRVMSGRGPRVASPYLPSEPETGSPDPIEAPDMSRAETARIADLERDIAELKAALAASSQPLFDAPSFVKYVNEAEAKLQTLREELTDKGNKLSAATGMGNTLARKCGGLQDENIRLKDQNADLQKRLCDAKAAMKKGQVLVGPEAALAARALAGVK